MNELKIEVTKEDLCIMVEMLYHERATLLRNTLQKHRAFDENEDDFQNHLQLFNRATDLFMAVKRCDRATFMIEGVKDENIA